MVEQVNIRFYEQLNDFLPLDRRKKNFNHPLKKSRSVKDLIESIGVPHTEIDLIIVNGESVGFDYPVKNADHISVYPAFCSVDVTPIKHSQSGYPGVPRFVLDVHLGRLAAYLRMLGFDALYRNDYDDPALADISAHEARILLTCDRLLLMRKQVVYGYFVRARQPHMQLPEVMSRFDLYSQQKPFTRCIRCNGKTRMVNKQDIEEKLLPKTKKYYDEFYQCDTCNKIYWKGSHYYKMQVMVENMEPGNKFNLSPGVA